MGVKLGFQAALLLASFTPKAVPAAVKDFGYHCCLPVLRHEQNSKGCFEFCARGSRQCLNK